MAYVLIGVALVIAIVLLARLPEVEADSLVKWLGFALVSAIVCGVTIQANRRDWKNRRFWLLLVIFFAVQSVLGVFLLSTVPRVSALYWGLFFLLDRAVLAAYLAYFSVWRRPAPR